MEKIQHKGYTLKIESDPFAESPDDLKDESVFLVGFHRDFSVERDGFSRDVVAALFDATRGPEESEHEERRAEALKIAKEYHVFPLEAYIHSGVSLYLSGGAKVDRAWDVSQLGAVFVAKTETKSPVKAEAIARGLLATWNQYLSDDVYYIAIVNQDGETMDSCGGYYGFEDAKQAAIEMADTQAAADKKNPPMYKAEAKKILEQWRGRFKDNKVINVPTPKIADALSIAINNL